MNQDQWNDEFIGRYGAAREEGASKEEAWDRADRETTEELGPRPGEGAVVRVRGRVEENGPVLPAPGTDVRRLSDVIDVRFPWSSQ